MIMKIAAIQSAPVFMCLNESIEKLYGILEKIHLKCDIAIFPETWLPGYPAWLDISPNSALWDYQPAKDMYARLLLNSIVLDDANYLKLIEAAKKFETHIIIGIHERKGNSIYNTQLFINKSGETHIHRKLTPTYTEKLIWAAGDGSTLKPIIQSEFGNIGGLICWEHWMPQMRILMHSFNEILHICQWPWSHELHTLAARQYAFEGQCYVVSSGCLLTKQDMLDGIRLKERLIGEEAKLIEEIPLDNDNYILKGGTSVIKANTDFLVDPNFNDEIIFSEIDFTEVLKGNLELDVNGHYSRPDIFELKINRDAYNLIV